VEHEELTQRTSRQSGRADEARRARLILLLDAGHTWASIREKLDCTDSFIARWSKRFAAERLGGLFSRHAGQLPTTLTPALEARIAGVERKAATPRWLDALEYAQTRCPIERQSHDGGAGVAQACLETASA
jgi:transposase